MAPWASASAHSRGHFQCPHQGAWVGSTWNTFTACPRRTPHYTRGPAWIKKFISRFEHSLPSSSTARDGIRKDPCSHSVPREPSGMPEFPRIHVWVHPAYQFQGTHPCFCPGQTGLYFLAIVFPGVLVASGSSGAWTCCSGATLTYACQISPSTPLLILQRDLGCIYRPEPKQRKRKQSRQFIGSEEAEKVLSNKNISVVPTAQQW